MVPWSQRFSNPRPPNIEQRRGEKGKKNTRRNKKGATFSFVAQDKRFFFVSDKSLVAQVCMNIHLFRSFIERDECCAKANRVNQDDRLPVLRDYVTSHEISRIHHAGIKSDFL